MVWIPPKDSEDIVFSYSPDNLCSTQMERYEHVDIILLDFC